MVEVVKVFLDDVVYNFDGRQVVMTVGTFDGVHLGHRKLISTAITMAKEIGGDAVVYTFRPHPTSVTRAYDSKSMLCSSDEKYKILGSFDLACILEQRFDQAFSEVSSYDFIEFLRRKFPTLRTICVGEGFRFGHDRLGDTSILAGCAKRIGINVVVVPPLILNGERVSSSKIRKLLDINDIRLANLMLGKDSQKACDSSEKSF
ncbi:MAG: FAD synthetase family protein [Puniceicoccales bacterium]|jgi:riboflavin kinase/FMN adenylyltransferase|nr:FAD synthetase family protein [Puniceicoccales bacterium]